jgi:hypothetical protein
MSTGDTPLAEYIPCTNFWAGGDGNDYIVVHATASGGVQTAYQLATSDLFNKGNDPNYTGRSASVHYVIGRGPDDDGKIYQCVLEQDSAWGNCCTDGNSPFLMARPNYNWNKNTISIENVKYSSDNSEPLTAKQYQSLLALVRDIAKRQNIPPVQGTPTQRGIIFHHDLMPKEKARCPGTFPYDTFFADLKGEVVPVAALKLDASGGVVTVQKSFQLEAGESPDLCGPWSVVALAFAVPPGQPLQKSAEDIDEYTDAMIAKIFPGLDYTNFPGVMPEDMITIMNHVRDDLGGILHYQVIPGMDRVVRALQAGYPCIISCNEADVNAWDKVNKKWVHAYTWNLSAGHVFPVTGIDAQGNLICPDQLNNAFQGYWPPTYNKNDIARSLSWAAVIQVVGPDPAHPWLAPIPSSDPLTWQPGFNAQLFTGGTPVPTPPTPAPTPNYKRQAFEAEWKSVVPDVSVTSGLANFAYSLYWTPNFPGVALSPEFKRRDTDGKEYMMQIVSNGILKWDGKAGHYYPYKAG